MNRTRPTVRRAAPGLARLRVPKAWALVLAAYLLVPDSLPAQVTIDERLGAERDAYIRIYSEAAGSVRVTGWDRDSVVVGGTRDSESGRFGIGGDGQAVKLGLWSEGAADAEAHLDVRVPATATLWVKVSDASIEIGDVAGGVDAYSVTGDIRVSGIPQQVYAESMGGRVEVVGTALSVRVKTGSGDITFRGEAEDVTLSTVGGRISVAGPRLRVGRFESVTGPILFDGELARGSSLGFHTHSGTIELRLPQDAGADFTVTSFEAEVESDFELDAMSARDGMRGAERQFSIGASGATVTIQSFSGPVRIRKR